MFIRLEIWEYIHNINVNTEIIFYFQEQHFRMEKYCIDLMQAVMIMGAICREFESLHSGQNLSKSCDFLRK